MAVVVGTLTAFGTPTNYLSTGLDSLATAGPGVALGAAINNTTNRHIYMKVLISLASADLSAQPSPGVGIRLVESLDGGTVYEDNIDGTYALSIPVAATSAAHVGISGTIYIPPGYFKLAVVNNTGVNFAASGNTLDYVTFTPDSV
jgi:hypothetical protein